MTLREMALFVVIVPALVAAGMVAVGRRVGGAGSGSAAVALGLGAGAIAAQLLNAMPAFPPIEVTDRIPWLVLAALMLGICESLSPCPAWARWENRLLLILLTLGLMLGPVLGPAWPTRADLVEQGGLFVGLLAVWAGLEALTARRSVAWLGPSLLVGAGCAGAALMVSGSLVLGQLGLGLASALAGVWVLSWWLPDSSMGRGGVPVLVASYAALVIEGHVYSSLPLASAILLALASLMAWAVPVGLSPSLATWPGALFGAVLTLVPAGAALGIAVAASAPWE